MLYKIKDKNVIKFNTGDIIINDVNSSAYMLIFDNLNEDYRLLKLDNGFVHPEKFNSIEELIAFKFGEIMLDTGYSDKGHTLIKNNEVVISN